MIRSELHGWTVRLLSLVPRCFAAVLHQTNDERASPDSLKAGNNQGGVMFFRRTPVTVRFASHGLSGKARNMIIAQHCM